MAVNQIFVNGNVITMDSRRPEVSAFAVTENRFCAVGSDDEIRKWADKGTSVVDLGRKTVVPGFIEPHSHISFYAVQLKQVDCSPSVNHGIGEVKDRIRAVAEKSEPGTWIRGFGYDDTLIEDKRHLTRSDLDHVAPENPVLIFHVTGHLCYTNSLGLKIGNITGKTPQPQGGEIHKDDRGEPTGLLLEPGAMRYLVAHVPLTTREEFLEVLPMAIRHYHQAGITGCHDAAIGFAGEGPNLFQAYQELQAKGALTLGVYMTIVEPVYRNIIEMGLQPGFGSDRLKLGSVKLFQDGSIQGHTAALRESYHNRSDFKGNLIMPQETLDALVEKYHSMGFQIAVHANGDRAIESVLTALEKADRRHPGHGANRHMIIHCQLASDDQIRRMKDLGVIPNYFVNHVYYWGDRHESIFLGPERARRIDPLQSTLDQGLKFVLHSDLPVTPVDPLFSIHAAVNRITREGKVLGEEERISPLEALKAYTTHAAFCSFEEDIKGSIEPGKLADFAVLSHNPLTVSSDKIKDIQVLQTVSGGRTVFERD